MKNAGFVEVSVSDTGVGIAPEDQETVFEEFRQVGASTAKQEGTGLGLALCRRAARWANLGHEPRRRGLDVHVQHPISSRRVIRRRGHADT